MSFTRKSIRYLVIIIALLALAACHSTNAQPTASLSKPTVTLSPLPATAPGGAPVRPTPTALSVADTETLVKEYAAAWDARNPDTLIGFYSHDVRRYDALSKGQMFDYLSIQAGLKTQLANDDWPVKFDSFFISDDARFAVMMGTFTQQGGGGKTVIQPYVSLLEFKSGLIIRVLDYYGGASSKGLPLQTFPAEASQPASSRQAIIDVKNLIIAWETAYNTKNTQTFLSFYADNVQYTQVVSPDWRVFTTKSRLSKEMTTLFNSPTFKPGLSSFIVSADGHYVAAQGLYTTELTTNTPMLMILQIEAGKIVQQYDYLVY